MAKTEPEQNLKKWKLIENSPTIILCRTDVNNVLK